MTGFERLKRVCRDLAGRVQEARPRLVLVLVLIAGVALGGLLLIWITPKGIGFYYDSMAYLEAAENLVSGYGLGRVTCASFRPLTRYPPLYSLLLAALNPLGFGLFDGARYLSAISLGITCVLVGATVWKTTRTVMWAVIGGASTLLSVPVLSVFSWAMSEPVYLVLWLASLLLLEAYWKSRTRWHLIAAASLSGLVAITRYIGITSIIANSTFLLWGICRRRLLWKDLGIYLSTSLAPLAVWLVRSGLIGANPVDRSLAFHPINRWGLRQGADTILGWFGPEEALPSEEAVALAVLGLFLLISIPVVATIMRRSRDLRGSALIVLHVVGSLTYLFGVLLAISVIDPGTPLDNRILIPTYVSLGAVLLSVLAHGLESRSAPIAALALLAFLALTIRQEGQLGKTISLIMADGQGYAASRWTQSGLAARLRELKPTTIYTNDVTAVYFVVRASSCAIPVDGAEDDLRAMRARLNDPRAVVAIFGELSSEFLPLERLTEDLVLLEATYDGRIYGRDPAGEG